MGVCIYGYIWIYLDKYMHVCTRIIVHLIDCYDAYHVSMICVIYALLLRGSRLGYDMSQEGFLVTSELYHVQM